MMSDPSSYDHVLISRKLNYLDSPKPPPVPSKLLSHTKSPSPDSSGMRSKIPVVTVRRNVLDRVLKI